MEEDLTQVWTVADLGRRVGASERTLTRLFRTDMGMTYPQWRTQIRLHHALRLLAEDRPVTYVAHQCGWATPSAFIDVYRRTLGQTPGTYAAPSHGEITAKYLGDGGDLLDGNAFAAGMCQVGIAGPVVDRGDTARREPGHVGPAILRPHHSPAAPTNSAAAGRSRPGSAPAAESVSSIWTSSPSNTSCTCTSACSGLRSGANRKFTVTAAASGITFPATPPSIRTADNPSRY